MCYNLVSMAAYTKVHNGVDRVIYTKGDTTILVLPKLELVHNRYMIVNVE